MTDYSGLDGIEIFFKDHAEPTLQRLTQQLDGHYSDVVKLEKLKPLFAGQNPAKGLATPDRLKETTASFLMAIIQTEIIEPLATDTTDKSSITVAMNRASPMVKTTDGRIVRLTFDRFEALLDDVLATKKKRVAIYINVDKWYYPADESPVITDFALVSEWKGTKVASTNTPTSTTLPSPPPTPSMPPTPVPTGSPNYAPNTLLMSPDCRDRYERYQNGSGYVLRDHVTDPMTLRDGSQAWYCPTGAFQFMTPDGSTFTKPPDIDRKALKDTNSPLSSDKDHEIRRWLQDTGRTMNNAQIFWPSFWGRRPGRGARGFTTGDTPDDDLPLYMAGYIQSVATLLHQWLLRKGTLPENSHLQDMVRLASGDGYVAINLIMQTVHPLEITNPTSMIPHFPLQAPTESFAQYYQRSIDYLQLQALILNVDTSFDDYRQQDFLVSNSLHPEFLQQEIAKFREDPRYKSLFTARHLLTGIQRIIAQAHSPLKDLFQAPSKSVNFSATTTSWKTKFYGTNRRQTPTLPASPATDGSRSNPIRINKLALFASTADSDSEPDFDAEMDAWQDEFLASVPDNEEDQEIARTFTARINQLGAKPIMKPKQGRKCLFCDATHSFDDCPVYQNKPYLQKPFLNPPILEERRQSDREPTELATQVFAIKEVPTAPIPAEPPPPAPPPAPDESSVPEHSPTSHTLPPPPVLPDSSDSGRDATPPVDCCVISDSPDNRDQGREQTLNPVNDTDPAPPLVTRNRRPRRSTKKIKRHKSTSQRSSDDDSVSCSSSDSGRADDDLSTTSTVDLPLNALDSAIGNCSEIIGIDPTTNPEHRPLHFDCDGDRALIDSGAWATCTNQRNKLHGYREYTAHDKCPVRLTAAIGDQETSVTPIGRGFLHVPCDNQYGFLAIFCYYHPALNTTVIDERSIGRAGGLKRKEVASETIKKFVAAGTCCVTITHKTCPHKDVHLQGILQNGKPFTHPLIPVYDETEAELDLLEDPEFAKTVEEHTLAHIKAYHKRQEQLVRDEIASLPNTLHKLPFPKMIQDSTPINAIRAETLRLLWHQRLGHCSDHYLYNAHKHIKGVPKFKHLDSILDTCPTCIRAKQTKEPAGKHTTRTATVKYQGLSVDFGFAGVRSADATKNQDFVGFNNETAWILISDHVTRMQHGATRMSKASPLAWLRSFLLTHAPECDGKYVFLDQGGELYRNPKVIALFEEFGYDVRPTGADSSNQNGPVERGHLTVANAVRSFLIGSTLDVKFWPYAFHHWIRITNALPSRDQAESPLQLAGEPQPDFSHLRTFGCRVWVRPPGRRQKKFVSASRKGIFLGYLPNTTTTNILWYDPETHRVKIAKHARFDEGMNDLPATLIPPNVVHLNRVQHGDGLAALEEQEPLEVPHFDCHIDPFPKLSVKKIKRRCNSVNFGMEFATDDLNNRAYLHGITKGSSLEKAFSTRKAATNKLIGAYIVRINDETVFTAEDVSTLLQRFHEEGISELTVEFAIEKALSAREQRRALREHNIFTPDDPELEDEHVHQITIKDIRHITAVRHPEASFGPEDIEVEQIHLALNAISSTTITDSERALGSFTRRKLKTLETWPDWKAGETKQLDHFEKLGMYGKPQVRPPGAIVLRPHWQYQLKRDGTRRSRNCCDGSKRAAPLLHKLAKTHSSCVEQPVQRLFFALSAHLGYRLYAGDAQDAYAHSPGLYSVPTYVSIDDAYAEWYFDKFNVRLDRSMVLPVLSALQGHPEAGRLWETHINKILKDEFNFCSTTHDRCIYRATVDGVPVLLLRQVDDFALACPNEALAKRIYERIGKALQRPDELEPPFKYLGPMTEFNGVDITQYDNSVKISCANYIDRVMQTHGWSTPLRHEATKPGAPLQTEHSISRLYKETGYDEDSAEHATLVDKYGFVYRQLLGELLYAYVTCRPDIGYSVITLSKFAAKPGAFHFQCLKDVALYLRRTKHWGIIYHKRHKDTREPFLPPNLEPLLPDDPELPAFPKPDINDLTLVCYVDAAHANDERTRRSTTGYSFQLAGGCIAYRCKTQSVTATSSTEAEFYAAVSAAKQAKYLRAILSDLGYPQLAATVLYCDNESAIKMINADIPTERSRHIDIQWFAIQDWKIQGHILMAHIPGKLNPADDFTKPLGWVLHARHARRTMGHYYP